MRKKILFGIGISFLLLFIGYVGVIWFQEWSLQAWDDIMARPPEHEFSDIDETIREGEAYGFKIGSSKEETFSRLAVLSSKGNVRWMTTYLYETRKNFPQPVEKIAEEFSDWSCWHISNFSDLELEGVLICFESSNHTLDTILGKTIHETWYTKKFHVWPQEQEGEGNPHLRIGMSYDKAYQAFLDLKMVEKYNNVQVKPKGFRMITEFTDNTLKRLKRQEVWYADLYPVPYGCDQNYIRLQFEQGKLIEITRRKIKVEPCP